MDREVKEAVSAQEKKSKGETKRANEREQIALMESQRAHEKTKESEKTRKQQNERWQDDRDQVKEELENQILNTIQIEEEAQWWKQL